MTSRLRNPWIVAIVLAGAVLPAAAAATATATDTPSRGGERGADPVLARAYEVRHRPLADAAELIGPLLSAEGQLSLRPRLKTLVVEDRVSVLDKVAAVLESFDLPPRTVEVTMTLFLGTDRREEQAGRHAPRTGVSREVRGVMETLGEFTKWTAYEPLGSRSIQALEGGRVAATLSDEYRVLFEIEPVRDAQDKVKFKSFALQRVVPTADGGRRYEDLISADVVLTSGVLKLVGATSGPDSNRALFITLKATPR